MAGRGGRANKILIMDGASLESRVGTAEIANQCSCLPKGTARREQGGAGRSREEQGDRALGNTKLAIN